MKRAELYKILKDHELWVTSSGRKGNRANLSGADLRRADLRRADLRRADLRRADLRRADLSGADLSGADLSEAYLSGADLRRADLRRADLRRANLWRADIMGANLSGADLRRADLRRADLEYTCIISATLGGHFAFYHEGYLNIGCEGNSLEWWLANYEEVGKKNGYSQQQIHNYYCFIRFLSDTIKYVI